MRVKDLSQGFSSNITKPKQKQKFFFPSPYLSNAGFMSHLLLTRSPYRQEYMNSSMRSFRRTRVSAIKWQFQFGPMTLIVALVVVALAMSMLYLMHFNQVATKGYDLKRLEVNRQQLMDQNQVSNMNIDKVKSMGTIMASTRIQTMVKANDVSFVRGDTALAKADQS